MCSETLVRPLCMCINNMDGYMTQYHLELRYSVSRGHETHGWTICSLYDAMANKKLATTMGGGYDLRATVLGEWMQRIFQSQLMALNITDFYGLFETKNGRRLDGGCGWSSMEAILKAMGYKFRTTKRDKFGNMVCFTVLKNVEAKDE